MKNNICSKFLSVILTLAMVVSLMPTVTLTASATGECDYVITGTAGSYNVYRSSQGEDSFSAFGTNPYSTVTDAMSAVTTAVGTGSAILYFGETMTGTTASTVIGTLDVGSEYVDMGYQGIYTLKGSLNASSFNSMCTLLVGDASVIVDGATLTSTSDYMLCNTGTGSVKVQSGTVESNSGFAICNKSTGTLTVTGGTVKSLSNNAICNESTGAVTITGGTVSTNSDANSAIYLSPLSGSAGNTVLEITGGSVINTSTSSNNTSGVSAVAISNDGCGTVKINGGTFTSGTNGNAIQNNSTGDINISGGTITGDVAGVYNASTGDIHLSSTPSISGSKEDIYTCKPIVANDGGATPVYYGGDALDVYYSGSITPGTTIAVSGVSGNGDKFTCANSDYLFSLSGTDLIVAEKPFDFDYVITGSAGSYNVYRSSQGADSFSALVSSPYSSIADAVIAVTGAVGSGSATLYFGKTMTGTTALTVSGTLDVGSGYVDLGSQGTYTLKGGLTGSADTCVLNLEGASVIVDGATLTSTSNGNTIFTNGVGSVTIKSGTVSTQGSQATILILGGSAGTTALEMMPGGSVTNTYASQTIPGGTDGVAIFNESSSNVNISGGTVTSSKADAIINNLTGDINISGGTISGDVAGVCNNASGHIHLSSTPSISGVRTNIYTKQPSTIVANDGAETPDYYSGEALSVYYEDYNGSITAGTTVAVSGISGNSNKFTCANEGYSLSLSGTDLVLVEKTNDYVITGSSSSYNVYRSEHDANDFSAFGTNPYSSVDNAVSAVTTVVGSGAATLYFGATGTGTSDLDDTLVLGTGKYVNLGSSGTYTLKGSLSSSSNPGTLMLQGASVIVDGATLANTGGAGNCAAIYNYGAGNITIKDGTLTTTGGYTIWNDSTGSVTVNGGTVSSDTSYSILNMGTGSISITGGYIYSGNYFAIHSMSSGTVSVSGDLWDADAKTGTYIGTDSTSMGAITSSSGAINISGGTISAKTSTITTGAGVNISAGRIQAGNSCALYLYGGTSHITGGTLTSANTQTDPTQSAACGTVFNRGYNGTDSILYISGGTIENTASDYPAVYNYNTEDKAKVHLSGTPAISGTADVWTNVPVFANDGAETPAYYSGDALNVEYGGSITAGTTVAVSGVVGNSDKFTCANPGYSFSLSGTDLVIAEKAKTYDYVITGSTTSCNVYRSDHDADSFSVLDGSPFSTITAAVSAVTTAVGDGSATLYFGKTMTGTAASTVSGTLDVDNVRVKLGSQGTYTLKGILTGSRSNTSCTLELSGASVIVDGATLTSTSVDHMIYNSGIGSVTVQSGTVESSGPSGAAIHNYSTGTVTVTGGTVTSSSYNAINNRSTGAVTVKGGTVKTDSVNNPAIQISGGSAGNTVLEITDGTVINSSTSSTDISGNSAVAITNQGCGTIKISGGTVKSGTNGSGIVNKTTGDINISGGAITGDFAGVYNSFGNIYMSSTPSISGKKAGINTRKSIVANDGAETPVYYSGDALSVYYNNSITVGTTVAVSGVSENSNKFTCANPGYSFSLSGTDLVIAEGAPTVLPTGGSFTNEDSDVGQISGTIGWTAASPADGITGYHIYWGSDTTTKLASDTDVEYDVTPASTESQTVAADTVPPSGANYFLIYSYNGGGDSATCLAVPITDTIGADYTVTNDTTDPAKYKVSGDAGTYDTLNAALAVCTDVGDDNKLTIQLGSADTPLEVPQVMETGSYSGTYPADNDLVTATYTGSVKITAVTGSYGEGYGSFGLRVPSGISAIFEGLTATADGTMNGESFSVACAVGDLTITTGTSITVGDNQNCVSAMGTYTIEPATQKITPVTYATFTMDGGSLSSDDDAVFLCVVNAQISGGTITSHGNEAVYSSGYANTQISGGTISGDEYGVFVSGGNVTISGSADIKSAVNLEEYESGDTAMLYKSANTSTATIFGKTVHASENACIVINGVGDGNSTSGANREIKSGNYTDAAVQAEAFTSGYEFNAWTSDAELENKISTKNDATNTITYLTTDANSGVTDIYLKMIQPAPTVLPTGGSFTDKDGDKGMISGTIGWTAASPADGITGYHIYWGSDTTTKLASDTDVEYDVASASTESQTVADNTDPPSGAKYFLIYSYNGVGDSATCLAVPITDVIGADYTVTNDTTDPSKYKVSGDDTVYETLSAALAVCTNAGGDNELIIQLGADSDHPLQIPQVGTSDSSFPNSLVSATYTGNVSITNKDITYFHSCGLLVPNGIEAHFNGLKIAKNAAIVPSSSVVFNAIYDLGTLYVEAGTDIQTTNKHYGVSVIGSSARFYMTGGSLDATGSGVCAYFENGSGGEISSGTINAGGDKSVAVYMLAGTSLKISGNAAISGSTTYARTQVISTSGNLTIEGGTVSTSSTTTFSSDIIVASGGTVTMKSGKLESISNSPMTRGINNTGANITISGGEITCNNNTGIAYDIDNTSTNTVTVSETAKLNVNSSNGAAIRNYSTGAVNITGGVIESQVLGIQNFAGGTVNISGGTIKTTGTSPCIENKKGIVAISEINSSAPTKIISSSTGNTISLAKESQNTTASIFGKKFHSSDVASAVINGSDNAGALEINKDNYGSATVKAFPDVGISFTAWTSDAALQNTIGTTNNVTISSLKLDEPTPSITDVYIKALPSIPTAIPTTGSGFTDGDSDKGQISGTIGWTAASPATGITGYHIYWGSDATTKLAGNTEAAYTVSGATTASQTVEADKALPSGAKYFLIYSYNSGGDSTNCLAVKIMDLPYSYSGGSGTEADPYQIATASDLEALSTLTNKGTDYSTTYFKQTANINLNEGVTFTFDPDTGLVEVAKAGQTSYWLGTGIKGNASGANATFDTTASTAGAIYTNQTGTTGSASFELNNYTPIGTSLKKFTGTLDGGGKTVSGVYINGTAANQGLFGFADNSTIKNVGVVNSYIKGNGTVGGVVGYSNNGSTVEKCYNAGTVVGGNAGTVGGVVGYNAYNSKISYSYNTGSVKGNGKVGGVAGENYSTVEYSYNTGSVNSTGSSVGGVVGVSSTPGSVKYCCNTGNVISGVVNTGGVVGESNSTVEYCYSAGDITGGIRQTGGVIGSGSNLAYCYYDSEKCSVKGIGNGTATGSDTADQAEGKQTSAMQGDALKTGSSGEGWTTDHWTFKSGEYPKPGKAEASNNPGNGNSGGSYTPDKTITVTETSSKLFKDSGGEIKAEANVDNAFSNSVEVKVTDTEEDASNFGLGAGNKVYPFDISLYIKGTDTKTEPKDGYTVTISLPIPEGLLEVKDQLSIMHKSDDGTVETLNSQLAQINGVWYLVFEAKKFSPYALVVKDIGTYDESAGLPYYIDAGGSETFIGFAANGRYIAPDGVTVLVKQNPKSFSDTSSHWAKNYVDFVAEREIFNGTSKDTFSPDAGMTRVMFATVIGRLYERSYGEIEVTNTHSFTDCNYADYYGKYVDWAAKEGIISGYGNGKFGPNDQISREQMAAILYRFANFLGALPADTGAALAYPDAGSISSWAQTAAKYCQQTGIITGRDGGSFVPQGTATRAEVSVILERFIENVLDQA